MSLTAVALTVTTHTKKLTPMPNQQSEGITIQMLYFASARTSLDKFQESIQLPSSHFPANKLKAYLQERYNGNVEFISVLNKSAISVNEEIVYDEENHLLENGDVGAIIPPVSGG